MARATGHRPGPSGPPRPTTPRPRHLRLIPGGAAAVDVHVERVPVPARRAAPGRPKAAEGRHRPGIQARRAPSLGFVVIAVLAVAVGVFGLVLLNVLTAQASFRSSELGEKVARAEAEAQRLRYELAVRESPERVAEAARSLGLVPPERRVVLTPPEEPSTSISTSPLAARSRRSDVATRSRP